MHSNNNPPADENNEIPSRENLTTTSTEPISNLRSYESCFEMNCPLDDPGEINLSRGELERIIDVESRLINNIYEQTIDLTQVATECNQPPIAIEESNLSHASTSEIQHQTSTHRKRPRLTEEEEKNLQSINSGVGMEPLSPNKEDNITSENFWPAFIYNKKLRFNHELVFKDKPKFNFDITGQRYFNVDDNVSIAKRRQQCVALNKDSESVALDQKRPNLAAPGFYCLDNYTICLSKENLIRLSQFDSNVQPLDLPQIQSVKEFRRKNYPQCYTKDGVPKKLRFHLNTNFSPKKLTLDESTAKPFYLANEEALKISDLHKPFKNNGINDRVFKYDSSKKPIISVDDYRKLQAKFIDDPRFTQIICSDLEDNQNESSNVSQFSNIGQATQSTPSSTTPIAIQANNAIVSTQRNVHTQNYSLINNVAFYPFLRIGGSVNGLMFKLNAENNYVMELSPQIPGPTMIEVLNNIFIQNGLDSPTFVPLQYQNKKIIYLSSLEYIKLQKSYGHLLKFQQICQPLTNIQTNSAPQPPQLSNSNSFFYASNKGSNSNNTNNNQSYKFQ